MNRLLPNFRDYDNPARKLPWGWDYGHGSARKRKRFKTKAAKNEFRKNFESRWYADRDALTSFDPEKWRRFLELERIAGSIDELEEAARSYDGRRFTSTQTFRAALEMKMADLDRIKAAGRKNTRLYCERFLAEVGDYPLGHYALEDVQKWIDGLIADGGQYHFLHNHLKSVRSVFNLAIKRGELTANPAQHVALPSTRGEKRVTLMTPGEIERLLSHVWSVDKGLAAVYGLLFFTGLRISMVAPQPEKRKKGEFIRRDMIDLDNKTIIIPAGIMKTGNALVIDEDLAPPNLWAWLEHVDAAKLPEPSSTFGTRRKRLCKAVGISWPENVHRRSCASYMAAIHGKEIAANLLGNTGEMIAKHYQVASFRRVAEAFTRIYPPTIAGRTGARRDTSSAGR